jgi:hypothetical protein
VARILRKLGSLSLAMLTSNAPLTAAAVFMAASNPAKGIQEQWT